MHHERSYEVENRVRVRRGELELTPSRLALVCQVKRMGFWGAKVPLPFSPSEGHVGMAKNIAFLQAHRDSVGPG